MDETTEKIEIMAVGEKEAGKAKLAGALMT